MPSLPLIVHRYVNRCATVAQPPGLADFLKGTVYLYQQSKRGPHCDAEHPRSFDLVVDFSQHPMGMFVMPPPTPRSAEVTHGTVRLTECFNQYRPVIRNLVATLQNNPETAPRVSYAICHEPYDRFDDHAPDVLSPDDQAFMRSVLAFHPELTEMADQYLDNWGLTAGQYAVLHLRMGDQQSADADAHAEQIRHVATYLETHLLPQWGKRVLVLSDSYHTKQYLKDRYGLPATDCVPVHMGESQRFLARGEAASPTDIGHTLVEFILMSRSAAVYVYSVYGWISGFSKLAAHIYGIPYVPISQG